MSLRFQKEDDVDAEIKKIRGGGALKVGALIVAMAVLSGIEDLIKGASLEHYEKELGFLFGAGSLIWIVNFIYWEFRTRTKEIDGKVSAIEQAVIASKEGHAELLERLTAIEEKLSQIQDAR